MSVVIESKAYLIGLASFAAVSLLASSPWPSRNAQNSVCPHRNRCSQILMNFALVSLTKVAKKTKDQKKTLMKEVSLGVLGNYPGFDPCYLSLSSRRMLTSGSIAGYSKWVP
jgi:hypothetical protein